MEADSPGDWKATPLPTANCEVDGGSIGIAGSDMSRDGLSVNLGDLSDSELLKEEGGML